MSFWQAVMAGEGVGGSTGGAASARDIREGWKDVMKRLFSIWLQTRVADG